MKTILTLALTFVAAAASISAAPATAQGVPAQSTLAVSYADLDLTTDAGIRTLDRRILSAVQQACGPVSAFDLSGTNRARECRADALARLDLQRQTAIAAARQAVPVQLAAQR